mgnify:CR=1 FL=1
MDRRWLGIYWTLVVAAILLLILVLLVVLDFICLMSLIFLDLYCRVDYDAC